MNRDDLRQLLLNDPRRKGPFGDRRCEGQAFQLHVCRGPLEMNVFQKLPDELKDYFYHPINCSLNCRFFHERLGHSSSFRQWYRYERLPAIFPESEIQLWIDQMPLKIKRVK